MSGAPLLECSVCNKKIPRGMNGCNCLIDGCGSITCKVCWEIHFQNEHNGKAYDEMPS